jgi:hypothetical protein
VSAEVSYPGRLLDPLEYLVEYRFFSPGGGVPRLDLASVCVTPLRPVLLGGSPDIPHIQMPDTITELANLADLHPIPTVSHTDFIVRTDPDPFS